MTELISTSTPEEKNRFLVIDKMSTPQKQHFIQNVIIPSMNRRRGKSENMTADEIHEKLYRPGGLGKPGETIELRYVLLAKASETITPEIASELADIVYYGLQPNAAKEDTLKELFISQLCDFVSIPMDAMLTFCIIKYSTRLKFGDRDNYKEMEFEVLERYLDIHPVLRDFWVTPPIPRTTIWDHVHGDLLDS